MKQREGSKLETFFEENVLNAEQSIDLTFHLSIETLKALKHLFKYCYGSMFFNHKF